MNLGRFTSGRGHYRGLTHDVRFDLADVTVLESIWPGWPFGQFSNTDNGVRVRFRSRRSLTLNGLSGYGTDYALDIKRAMGRGGYGDVELSMEEIGLFRGLIPRRPDRGRGWSIRQRPGDTWTAAP